MQTLTAQVVNHQHVRKIVFSLNPKPKEMIKYLLVFHSNLEIAFKISKRIHINLHYANNIDKSQYTLHQGILLKNLSTRETDPSFHYQDEWIFLCVPRKAVQ